MEKIDRLGWAAGLSFVSYGVRGPFNDLPRLPFQLGNCLARTAKFTARLPKLLREQ